MRIVWTLIGMAVSVAAMAQEVPQGPPPLTVSRAAAAITLDGDLSDPGWENAAKIDRFYETSPGNNTEPRVKTIVYLTYDDRYFYIGIHCEDPQPDKISEPHSD